ncbi:MAG TPA: hypothetical protein VD926_03105 [Acidimicrobiales bacterium]|nr:hypothetical protein [Acidimicrobiales bacterium]
MDPSPRSRLGLAFAVLVVVASAGMWVYLFFIADPDVPARLEDDAFAEEGQAICESAVARIDELPNARDAESPEDRAPVVEEANGILRGMVEELRAAAPTEGSDGRITRLWLEDWDTYLGDRTAYAEALSEGEDAELLVTPRSEEEGGGQITETIDHFAQINDMEDCVVPGDV